MRRESDVGTANPNIGDYRRYIDDRPVFTCSITYVGVKVGTRETMPAPPAVRELMDAPARRP